MYLATTDTMKNYLLGAKLGTTSIVRWSVRCPLINETALIFHFENVNLAEERLFLNLHIYGISA